MKFTLGATTGHALLGCLLYTMPPAFAGQKSSVAQTTPELVVQLPQSGEVNAFTFSPDGSVLAVSSQDGLVRMLDIATGSILLQVPVEGANPGSFCFSPDGKLFATSALNDAIILRDSKTGAVLYRLEGHSQTCFAFSPTSGLIAAGTAEDNIALIDYYTGNVVRTIRSHSGWLNVLRFSEDGAMLACSGGSLAEKAGAEIFSVKTGSLVRHIDLKDGATAFAFSRDSRTLALGSGRLPSGGPGVALFDIGSGTIARTMQGREFEATALQFTKDGTQLVGTSQRGITRVWNNATGAAIRTFGKDSFVVPTAIDLRADRIASCVWGGTIIVYDVSSGASVFRAGARLHDIEYLTSCNGGNTLVTFGSWMLEAGRASSAGIGEVRFWDVRTGICSSVIDLDSLAESWQPISVTQDGSRMATLGRSRVTIWDVAAARKLSDIGELKDDKSFFRSLALSANGAVVAIYGERAMTAAEKAAAPKSRGMGEPSQVSFVQIWDVPTHTLKHTLSDTDVGIALALSPDGARLYTQGSRGSIVSWNLATARVEQRYKAGTNFYSLRLSTDGRTLCGSGDGPVVYTWNINAPDKPITNAVDGSNTCGIAVNANGTAVAVGNSDGRVSVYRHGDPRAVKLGGPASYVRSLTFLQHDSTIASLDDLNGVRLWDAATGRLRATIQLLGSTLNQSEPNIWVVYTPDGFLEGPDTAEQFLKWLVNGALVTSKQISDTHRRPDIVNKSLSGSFDPDHYDRAMREAEQRLALESVAPVPEPEPAHKAKDGIDPKSPTGRLKASLGRADIYAHSERIAEVVATIKHAIADGADINYRNGYGETALLFLARHGDLEGVKDLVRRRANLNLSNVYGTTAVLGAAENDHYEVVKCLLDAGANMTDDLGHSLTSARGNRRALGEALLSVLNLSFGPHLNHALDAEKTGAYYFDEEGTALVLLYLGAPGNITNKRGGSLIAHTQSERLVRKLVAAGADFNDFHSSSDSALMFWITQNNIPLVKLAHELGADVNKADKRRYTPLMTAAGGGKEEIVNLLLEWNANVNATDDNGENALLHAVFGGYPDIVRILAERGANLELKDRYSHLTAIAHAVRDGDLEMTKILIDRRASMKDTGADLMELAAEADQRGHFGMTELLKTYRGQTK